MIHLLSGYAQPNTVPPWGQLKGGWSNSLPVTGLSKHIWGVTVPSRICSAHHPARSALDNIKRIYVDIPLHTDHTYGVGATARLEPVLSRGWFWEPGWIAADSIFETCGYSEGGITTRLITKRAGRFIARNIFQQTKSGPLHLQHGGIGGRYGWRVVKRDQDQI